MALKRGLHLDIEAVIGSQKVGADQQQYDVGFLEIAVDRLLPLIAGADLAIVPGPQETLSLKQFQVLCEFVPQMLVAMRIRAE